MKRRHTLFSPIIAVLSRSDERYHRNERMNDACRSHGLDFLRQRHPFLTRPAATKMR
ncbi:hypothetical protein RRSWK_07063 [Rhodopirellula sp. SWK7]|nr:hypothetical protein RRSWK_07063 [Rhodopirellula sp. SWK7]